MYSQGARAASVLSTRSCFCSFEKQYQVFNGLDGLRVPLLVYTNHIDNEKHVHHGFLAPRPYLCSTSLIHYDQYTILTLLCKKNPIKVNDMKTDEQFPDRIWGDEKNLKFPCEIIILLPTCYQHPRSLRILLP